MWGYRRKYVSVAQRARRAAKEIRTREKAGRPLSPVVIEGRTIARSFWGKAWCENLEWYSDYASRMPRGRTYARNGLVIHLDINAGFISGIVSGSDLYDVHVEIAPIAEERWASIRRDCAGSVDSLVELLQGRLSDGVMERVCRHGEGLFPAPAEITLMCSCPDWAVMCKHVAGVLYGVGARLDHEPDLLFRLRQVDPQELVQDAAEFAPLSAVAPSSDRVLGLDGLSELFGLNIMEDVAPSVLVAEPELDPALSAAVARVQARLVELRGISDGELVGESAEMGRAALIARLQSWVDTTLGQ